MRFSADAEALGWMNCTSLALPMLNDFQSMMARCVAWFTVKRGRVAPAAVVLISACPLTTPRSCGKVAGGSGGADRDTVECSSTPSAASTVRLQLVGDRRGTWLSRTGNAARTRTGREVMTGRGPRPEQQLISFSERSVTVEGGAP